MSEQVKPIPISEIQTLADVPEGQVFHAVAIEDKNGVQHIFLVANSMVVIPEEFLKSLDEMPVPKSRVKRSKGKKKAA